MDLLALRFIRAHGVRAMSHWEASPFQTEDGQDVVKPKGPHVVSAGWERVVSKDTGGGSTGGGGVAASIAATLGEQTRISETPPSSISHGQKAFLLLIGGFIVVYVRRWLRSQKRPSRPAAVAEVPPCTHLHCPASTGHGWNPPRPARSTSHPDHARPPRTLGTPTSALVVAPGPV